jgi:hypothetical protein
MSVRERVSDHRKRLRMQGLRPIQIWVPDVRSAAFADEARRQSLAVAMADAQSDDQDFVEAVSTQIDKVTTGTSSHIALNHGASWTR